MSDTQIDVFVSYASADRSRVMPFVRTLEAQGWQVWWDRNIEAGAAFDREIETAVSTARCVVVVWSTTSIDSDWVRAEAGEGLDRGVLIPLMLDDVRPPLAFRRTQAVTDSEPNALAGAVAQLLHESVAGPAQAAAPSEPTRQWTPRLLVIGLLLVIGTVAWLVSRPAQPPPTAAQTTRDAVAVMPFVIRGDRELDYLEHGMVDLLATRLDGLPDYHGVDSFTLIKTAQRWPQSESDPAIAAEVAKEVGANRFIMGSITGNASEMVVSANLFGIDGQRAATARVNAGGSQDIIGAIDELTHRLIASELSAPFESYASLGALTTTSTDALRAYLAGEHAFRIGNYPTAVFRFQEATQADPEFALAWFRIVIAATFTDTAAAFVAQDKLRQLRHKLPLPQQKLQQAYQLGDEGRLKAARAVTMQLVAAYPDDIEAIRFLGEIELRHNQFFGKDARDAAKLFERILAIDPDDTWARMYMMELAAMDGDHETIRAHASKLGDLVNRGSGYSPEFYIALAAYLDGSLSAATMAQAFLEQSSQTAQAMLLYTAPRMRDRVLSAEVYKQLRDVLSVTPAGAAYGAVIAASQGDWQRVNIDGLVTPEQWLAIATIAVLSNDVPNNVTTKAIQWLDAWDPDAAGLAACANDLARSFGCDAQAFHAARDFYLYSLRSKAGDMDSALEHFAALAAIGANAPPESLPSGFFRMASAQRALADGQTDAALDHLNHARIGVPYLSFVAGPLEGLGLLYQPLLAWNTWLTARTEQAAERPAQARRWYRSASQTGYWSLLWHDELNVLLP